MKNIALFGGSFDPPHIGHIQIAEALKNLDFIEKVVVMPTYLNPLKSSFFADANLRLQWLKEIFEDDKSVEVSSFEVEQKRKVPSIETVKHLKKFHDNIHLVIGADNLASLSHWYKYEELKSLVKFIIISRNEIDIPESFIKLELDIPISSTELRGEIDTRYLPQKVAKKIENYYKENNAN
ncbi:MAG: nicotinate (nicotinamide) nucleotide adenylyltransferase [Campylobacterales bacterium]|nr:nicotinate (nicotinamide) nucleotide adenylyltransferase [Campylobacterales bacterium]